MIKKEQERPACAVPKCDRFAAKLASKSKLGFSRYGKYCNRHKREFHGSKYAYRRFKGGKCVKCGFTPIHSAQLDVDHIDENHNNDDPANLQTLCKNCHSLKTHAPKLFNLDPSV